MSLFISVPVSFVKKLLSFILLAVLLAGCGVVPPAPCEQMPTPSPSPVPPSPTTAIAQLPTRQPVQPSLTATTPPPPTDPPLPPTPPPPTPLPPTATLAPLPSPSPLPYPSPVLPALPEMPVIGYHAHTVAEGETLAAIAVNGGSDAALIQAYNQLEGPPTPGCPLIVPHLQGQINVLPEEPLLVVQGCTTQPIVALTLDAGGGSEPTAAMLDALRERNIRITFFLTGDWIAENPDLVRQIVADGHEVANHSRTHADFTTLDKAQMIEELAETERLFRETTGVERMRPFFRPPYGAYDRDVLLTVIEQGYMPIYWTLDSLDSYGEPKTPQFLLERVTTTLAPDELRGAIILAHCGSEATAEALPDILDRLTEMGFDVRPLSDVV